jgi:hypothetical protein
MNGAGNTRLVVTFSQHLAPEMVASLTSQIAQYGLLEDSQPPEQIAVDVRRVSKLGGLKAQLTAWEREGYLRWADGAAATGR